MRNARATLMLAALAGGIAASTSFGGMTLTAGDPAPRVRGYRQGRRFGYGMNGFVRGRWPGQSSPAGTKLARKAAKGTLTHCGIR